MKANEEAKKDGKKIAEINDERIYKRACDIIGGKYTHFENRMKNKFFAVKKPQDNKTGFGYDTGDNLCLDLYYDKEGKLCGEIIRKIDFASKKVPVYKKDGYVLFERIYQGDTLEVDLSNDKTSLKNKIGSAPDGRTFVEVVTFTEMDRYYKGNKTAIQIHIKNLLKSDRTKDGDFYISSMQKYNPRKIILTSLGIIKYRSQILKDKKIK